MQADGYTRLMNSVTTWLEREQSCRNRISKRFSAARNNTCDVRTWRFASVVNGQRQTRLDEEAFFFIQLPVCPRIPDR
jgi:hypothetical protein